MRYRRQEAAGSITWSGVPRRERNRARGLPRVRPGSRVPAASTPEVD
jgi:hypothetical protein